MYKTYLVGSFITALLVLLGAAAINYSIDPAHLFDSERGYESRIAKLLQAGNNITNVSNYDERITQKLYIDLLAKQPDIVVLGSSRSMQIRASNFGNNTFFNHSVSGGSLEDHMAIYQMYYNKNLIPEIIILGLDPWIFNTHSGQTRWQSISDYLYEIGDRLLIQVPFQSMAATSGDVNRHLQLFSFAYFRESLNILWKKFRRMSTSVVITNDTLLPNNTKLSDGSLVYGSVVRNRSVENVRARATANAQRGAIYALGLFNRLNSSATLALDKFIHSILSDGARPIIFMPPYHPSAYRVIKSDDRYRSVLEAEKFLRQLSRDRGIPILGSYNPDLAGCSEAQFTDEMHPTEECVTHILHKEVTGK